MKWETMWKCKLCNNETYSVLTSKTVSLGPPEWGQPEQFIQLKTIYCKKCKNVSVIEEKLT
jgi:hypothetical protein